MSKESNSNETADENRQKAIRHIVNNYAELEASIVSQLSFQSQHPGTSGGFREEIWKAMFEQADSEEVFHRPFRVYHRFRRAGIQ